MRTPRVVAHRPGHRGERRSETPRTVGDRTAPAETPRCGPPATTAAHTTITTVSLRCASPHGCLLRSLAIVLLCRARGQQPVWCVWVRAPQVASHALVEADGPHGRAHQPVAALRPDHPHHCERHRMTTVVEDRMRGLADQLRADGAITTDRVHHAFATVSRHQTVTWHLQQGERVEVPQDQPLLGRVLDTINHLGCTGTGTTPRWTGISTGSWPRSGWPVSPGLDRPSHSQRVGVGTGGAWRLPPGDDHRPRRHDAARAVVRFHACGRPAASRFPVPKRAPT